MFSPWIETRALSLRNQRLIALYAYAGLLAPDRPEGTREIRREKTNRTAARNTGNNERSPRNLFGTRSHNFLLRKRGEGEEQNYGFCSSSDSVP